ILEKIALARVLIFRLEKNGVLRRELELYLAIGLGTRDLVVRPAAIVVLEFRIERVTNVAEDSVLRSGLANLAGAKVGSSRTNAKPVGFEHLRILLLRNILRQRSAADRCEQVCE